MSETTTKDSAESNAKAKPDKEYGFSVLVSGFARMWRGFGVAIVIILLNALVQAALVIGDPTFGIDGGAAYLLALVSLIATVITGAVLTATGLESVKGKANRASVMPRIKSNFLMYAVWVIGVGIVALLGALLYGLPGLLVVALTPFVGIAAMDGQKNALAADLKAISARPIRWAVTVIIVGIIGLVVYLVAAANTFLITGPIASFLTVTIAGFVAYWLITAWSCLYRSTPVGATDAPQEEAV